MKIDIEGSYVTTCLAQLFAGEIYAAVIRQHLRAVGDTEQVVRDQTFFQVKSSIASIDDAFERRYFIARVRYYFRQMRDERGTAKTTREYVARVNAWRQKEGAAAA